MADDACETDRVRQCDVELRQESEIDDPTISILPETDAGPVVAEPPSVIQLQQASGYPNFIVLGPAAPAAPAAQGVDTRVQGYVEPDDSLLNVSEYTLREENPLLVSFGIMDFVEHGIKGTLFDTFDRMFHELHVALSNDVSDQGGAAKGFVGITRCGFLSKYTTVIYYAGRILFERYPIFRLMETCYQTLVPIVGNWNTIAPPEITNHVEFTCKFERSPLQYDTQKIILCIKLKSSGNIIQIPILNVVGFPVFQDVNPLIGLVTPTSLPFFVDQILPSQTLSLLDIIVRVRLCANQGAITALSEPSKEEVTLILHCFQGLIPTLPTVISTITQGIHQILYNTEANIKPFALFCNIFYNFINVSLGSRSLAKIIYSDFFGASDNYGTVIRACQVVNGLPIMNEHVKFFLTGSNAARVYLALNDIIKLGEAINPETIAPILKKTFGNLSDNDFMIYLNREVDEPYRVFIRMILGGSFYFFKDLFDPRMLAAYDFTGTMIESVGIVGYMDHLFAQRFDAKWEFLRQCYTKDPTSFLANILQYMPYFDQLDKQINVAHLDGVFKYYTLEKFYKSILSICNSIPFDITNLNIEALNASFTILQRVINHIITTLALHDKIKSNTINVLFIKFSQFYTTRFIPQLMTDIVSLPAQTLIFFPTAESLISLDNLIMLLDELIKYMTKHNINYVYRENTDDEGNVISRETSIELSQTLLGMFEYFKNSNSFKLALDFLIDKATSIDCIATVWTLVLNVLYTLFVPENCLARIAVGKFDNDPKNLKLYMEILNAHLLELQMLGNNHRAIPELLDLQTRIATMCQTSITTGARLQPHFKQTCDAWVKKMVEMAASGAVGQRLFMLSKSDVTEIRKGHPTKLEKALCLAYYPTQQGNICSAASNGPDIFLQALRYILNTSPIEMDITKSTDPTHEVALHDRLIKMGSQFGVLFTAIGGMSLPIQPEGTTQPLSTYLNFLWKHLTTTAIDLKIFFKGNLTDIKRVTGIKYIALVLGGYFQIRLLIDDVSDQCPDAGKRRELELFKTSQEMMACKRGLLPLLIAPPILALIQYIFLLDVGHGINVDPDPVPRILKILGFLFSIKVKSSSPHSPYQLLRLEDSILSFPIPKDDPRGLQILNPTSGMFIEFLRALGVPITKETMKCICRPKDEVARIDTEIANAASSNPLLAGLYRAVGGSNNSESNSGRKSVSSLNKHNHKYKHNKLARNNRTYRNKNKRKKNSKSKSHKPKPNPKSKPKSRKSKSGKSKRKNVTFKRRKRSNRH